MYVSSWLFDNHYIKNITNGCIVGAIGTTLFQPIDALAVRLFYKKENIGNIRSLYNGFRLNIFSGIGKAIITFPIQEWLREQMTTYEKKKMVSPIQSEIIASMASGTILGILGTPINVIKIPLQSNRTGTLTVLCVIQHIHKQYGFNGFLRGCIPTMLRDISYQAVYFPLYRYLNQQRGDVLLPSIFSGVCAVSTSYVFDGIRLARQNHRKNFDSIYGIRESIQISKSNIGSLLVRIVRVPAHMTVCHMLYIWLS